MRFTSGRRLGDQALISEAKKPVGPQRLSRLTAEHVQGWRRGEMLGLQWADIELDIGTLHVRRALQRFGGDGVSRV